MMQIFGKSTQVVQISIQLIKQAHAENRETCVSVTKAHVENRDTCVSMTEAHAENKNPKQKRSNIMPYLKKTRKNQRL